MEKATKLDRNNNLVKINSKNAWEISKELEEFCNTVISQNYMITT